MTMQSYACRITALLLGLSCCVIQTLSFVPTVSFPRHSSSLPTCTMTTRLRAATSNNNNNPGGETEAECLLRKARELKAQAEAEERALHESLLTQKERKDQQLDKCIDALFPPNTSSQDSVQEVVKRLKNLQYSTDKLLDTVTRLYERELKAKGIHQVEAYFDHDTHHTGFERVAKEQDQVEAERVSAMIDELIEAAAMIDEEYLAEKRNNKQRKHLTHVEMEHWTVGECASILSGKIRELRREHEQQFQERLHSFYKAQRKKDLPPPPDYMP